VIERIRAALARARATTDWSALGYAPTAGEDGETVDGNQVRRALVLWGLQYDRRPADLPLVRWLAEQEAVCRREAGGGLGAEAELAGYLLATYREVDDVWRHWAIKRANFDAGCGYDAQHLVAAGVTETIARVRAADHPERAALLEYLTNLTETDLDDWWRRKQEWYPTDPAEQDLLTWCEHAELLGERAEARTLLLRWVDGQERTEETLSIVCSWLADLGYHAEAADAQRARIALLGDAPATDLAMAHRKLAEQERAAGRYVAALAALRDWARALAGDGRGAGLGRSYVEEHFLLGRDADGEVAAAAFAEGDRVASTVSWLPFVVLAAAADAAANVGAEDRAAAYVALRDAERARIDAMG
jgi:hypothetical protein